MSQTTDLKTASISELVNKAKDMRRGVREEPNWTFELAKKLAGRQLFDHAVRLAQHIHDDPGLDPGKAVEVLQKWALWTCHSPKPRPFDIDGASAWVRYVPEERTTFRHGRQNLWCRPKPVERRSGQNEGSASRREARLRVKRGSRPATLLASRTCDEARRPPGSRSHFHFPESALHETPACLSRAPDESSLADNT